MMGGNGSEEEALTVETFPCKICSRSFTEDRLLKHEEVCSKQRQRDPFDITLSRIAGTDAEELLKAGKLKLEPPRFMEKKSSLTKKLFSEPLPPIKSAVKKRKNKKKGDNIEEGYDNLNQSGGKSVSYQVVFGPENKVKTHAPSAKFAPNLPVQKLAKRNLPKNSGKARWRSATKRISPLQIDPRLQHFKALSQSYDTTGSSLSEESDVLGASMASRRSDAFDFLFDERNLNPNNLLKNINRSDSTTETTTDTVSDIVKPELKAIVEKSESKESCCVIL